MRKLVRQLLGWGTLAWVVAYWVALSYVKLAFEPSYLLPILKFIIIAMATASLTGALGAIMSWRCTTLAFLIGAMFSIAVILISIVGTLSTTFIENSVLSEKVISLIVVGGHAVVMLLVPSLMLLTEDNLFGEAQAA